MNYFSAEDLLKERLKATVPQVPQANVFLAADLEGVLTNNQKTPSLQILYFNDEPNDTPNRGKTQCVTQYWLVVVVNRNVKSVSGKGSRDDVGETITAMLNSVQGFQPTENHTPFVRVKTPFRNNAYKDGFSYFYFMFSTKIIF